MNAPTLPTKKDTSDYLKHERADLLAANAALEKKNNEMRGLLFDAAMQLERLEGQNLAIYARTFAALARNSI